MLLSDNQLPIIVHEKCVNVKIVGENISRAAYPVSSIAERSKAAAGRSTSCMDASRRARTPASRPTSGLLPALFAAYHTILNQALLYTYQHLLTEGLDNEASRLFLTLATEDTAQFRMLGRIIRALGGDPGVAARLRTPHIDLSDDASCRALPVVRRMVQADLAAEAALIPALESLAIAIGEESTLPLGESAYGELRRLIADTRGQYERLEELLHQIG